MAKINQDLCQIHIIGRRTKERLVGQQKCPEMAGLGKEVRDITDELDLA